MTIKTTTIGSFPKPTITPVKDWFFADKSDDKKKSSKGLLSNWEPGEYERALFEAGEKAEERFVQATKEVITDQVNSGISIPTDGEVRRENYIWYQCRRIEGISFNDLTKKSVRSGAFEAELPSIVAPVSLKKTQLYKDWEVAQRFTRQPVKITLPGPMTIADSVADIYYGDKRKLSFDLALALNIEVKALAEAGCQYVQVDEPVFARKPEDALSFGFEDLERTFHGISNSVTRVIHMCCGYPNSLDSEGYMKANKDSYFKILGTVEDSSINEVSIEDAHRHNDLKILEKLSNTKVILGVLNIANSRLETVDEIRDRLLLALEHIDKDRLIVGPDCGLGFFSREQAIKKMKKMTEAVRAI